MPAQDAARLRGLIAQRAAGEDIGAAFKVLVGRPEARIRWRDWRALVTETETTLTVLDVGHRSQIYR